MTPFRTVSAILATVTGLGWSGPARAWDAGELQYAPADGEVPGGGGIIGTGSRSDQSTECIHCHIDAEQQIDLTFTPSPAFAAVGDELYYEPGQVYQFTVEMSGEWLGISDCPTGGPNGNMIAATFEDDSGANVGTLQADSGQTQGSNCPSTVPDPDSITSGTTLLAVDCRVILTRDATPDLTEWIFRWTAPPAGTGNVTLFGGGVDGNCDMSSLGDDVKMVKIALSDGSARAALSLPSGGDGAEIAWASTLDPVLPWSPYGLSIAALGALGAWSIRRRRD